MGKYRYSIVLVLFLVSEVCKADKSDKDWHYWNEFVLEYEATERVTAELKSEQVFIDNFSDFALYNFTVGAKYSFSDYFALGVEYMYEKEEAGLEWPAENRYSIVPVIKWKVSDSKWSLRTKIDYRDFDSDAFWRIRERLQIKVPARIGEFIFTPFVSDEIYYSFKIDRFSQNRFKVGAGKDCGEHLELILYYMNIAVDIPDDNDWTYTNLLGTEVVIKF